jgi:hypothetical protein
MSVEFPYTALPRAVWERELAHLKEMGVDHISLPASKDAMGDASIDDVIRVIRRLGLEADLESPLPDRLQSMAKSHGGPLTEALSGAVRISATMPRALDNERKLLTSGTQAIIWTDAFETLTPYQPGAITLAGSEGPGAALIRREAQLARSWGSHLSALPELPGARLTVPVEGVSVHQYVADKVGSVLAAPVATGVSLASVTNDSPDPWTGEVRVMYPPLQRPIGLPAVAVPPHDVLWLPIDIPLTTGPLCSGCTGFAPADHLAYATAELTGMEYENGVLALEFIAPKPGEAVLQLSHEPVGPLVAGGRPTDFDWDPQTKRVRVPIPAGNAKTGRVRVALAIDAPPITGFFENASVLLIGETNRLTAEFSPPAVAARSRMRANSEVAITQEEPAPKTPVEENEPDNKDKPALIKYKIAVPPTAIPGDVVQLVIDADGAQLSHSELHVVPPAALTLEDAVSVRINANSFVPLTPPTIPVNQKSGREIVVTLRNNALEIRTFDLAFSVPGLDFSPAKMTVSVGASVARDVTFRVFSSSSEPGIHEGELKLSGATTLTNPVRFVVLQPAGTVTWSTEGFTILESTRLRASFLGDRWLEMINKDSGRDSQPAGGTVFTGGSAESLKMEDLEKLVPPPPVH